MDDLDLHFKELKILEKFFANLTQDLDQEIKKTKTQLIQKKKQDDLKFMLEGIANCSDLFGDEL